MCCYFVEWVGGGDEVVVEVVGLVYYCGSLWIGVVGVGFGVLYVVVEVVKGIGVDVVEGVGCLY